MELISLVLWTHLASTLFMVGLIWFVQVVHYPLFADVPTEGYRAYQEKHMARTGLVVGPPMLAEAGSSLGLILLASDLPDPSLAWIGFALLAFVWGVTALFSVPAHGRLLEGFDEGAHRTLVRTNWLRALGWSVRGGLAIALLS